MKNIQLKIAIVVAVATLFSCKDEEIPVDHNTYYPSGSSTFTVSMGQAESMAHDILRTALYFACDTSLRHFAQYPIVTSTSDTSYPRTITIDFGNTDTTTLLHTPLNDMRIRNGILSITLSDDWHHTGATATVTATSLGLSQLMTFTGVIDFANRGQRSYQSRPCYTFDFVTNNVAVEKKDGFSFKYSATKVYHLLAGDTTQTLDDDIFHISGTASATQDTNNITLEIMGPYSISNPCFWFRSGTARITENTIKWELMFENSTCQPLAYLLFRNNINQDDPNQMRRYIDLP